MENKSRISIYAFLILLISSKTQGALDIGTSVSLKVIETEKDEISLGCLTCVHDGTALAGEEGIITMDRVSVTPSFNCGTCFDVFYGPDKGLSNSNNMWCVFYLPSEGKLNYTRQSSYTMNVECIDGFTRSTSDITIKVDPNQPPLQTSSPKGCDDISASTPAGTTVYNGLVPAVVDPDQDDLKCTMTTVPESDNFEMDPDTCTIQAKNDLARECNPTIKFLISVTDGHNLPIGPIAVTCAMSGASERPIIANLNRTAIIPEDKAVGAVAYTFTDTTTPTVFTITGASNPNALGIFDIDGDTLVLKQELNYEDVFLNNFRIYIEADNDNCDAVQHYLDIQVAEVNEPPILTARYERINVNEENAYANPEFDCDLQEEIDEVCRYRIIAGNDDGHFSINPETGEITSTTIDVDSNTEEVLYTLEVEAYDNRGLSDTATVHLVVNDINDNKPIIQQADAGLSYTVTACTEPTLLPVRFEATDEDSIKDSNNVITFVSAGGSSDCVNVLPDGTVQLTRTATPITVTEYCTARVRAVDRGGNAAGSLTSDVTAEVTITVVPCPTTVAPEEPAPGPTGDSAGGTPSVPTVVVTTALSGNTAGTDFGLIFGILGGILGAILMASLLAWCCRRRCCAKKKTAPFSSEETASKKKQKMSKLKKKKKTKAAAAAAVAPVAAAAAAAPMLVRIRRKIPFMTVKRRVPIKTVSRLVPMTTQPPVNTTIPVRSASGIRTVFPAPPPYRMANSAPMYGSYA